MSSYVGGKVSLEANCRRGSEYGHGGKRGSHFSIAWCCSKACEG